MPFEEKKKENETARYARDRSDGDRKHMAESHRDGLERERHGDWNHDEKTLQTTPDGASQDTTT